MHTKNEAILCLLRVSCEFDSRCGCHLLKVVKDDYLFCIYKQTQRTPTESFVGVLWIYSFVEIGKETVKTVFLLSELTVILPLCNSTIRFTIESPMPLPSFEWVVSA